jgi:adenosylcobinamide-GDP ribazoletransferase
MRDSRIGSYGVLALVLVIALRIALRIALLSLDLAGFARAMAVGHVLGRAAWLPLVRLLPAASPGLGPSCSARPRPPAGSPQPW